MKRVNTGDKTKSDPDSRINKSLRKWNCKCSSAMEFGAKLAESFTAEKEAARGDMLKAYLGRAMQAPKRGRLKAVDLANKLRQTYRDEKGHASFIDKMRKLYLSTQSVLPVNSGYPVMDMQQKKYQKYLDLTARLKPVGNIPAPTGTPGAHTSLFNRFNVDPHTHGSGSISDWHKLVPGWGRAWDKQSGADS